MKRKGALGAWKVRLLSLDSGQDSQRDRFMKGTIFMPGK